VRLRVLLVARRREVAFSDGGPASAMACACGCGYGLVCERWGYPERWLAGDGQRVRRILC
jgi:hypothetical protein